MASTRTSKHIPPPPSARATDRAKAAYYEAHDPVDLIDAGYFEAEGLYEGAELLVDLRPERGLATVPVRLQVARRLCRAARRAGCTPSELASRWLARGLGMEGSGTAPGSGRR